MAHPYSIAIQKVFTAHKTDTTLLAKYIENCALEEDFFIRKAIGWALRAYAYTDAKWVKEFIKTHPHLSNLSKREALKHQ